jgi:hypothetical protein
LGGRQPAKLTTQGYAKAVSDGLAGTAGGDVELLRLDVTRFLNGRFHNSIRIPLRLYNFKAHQILSDFPRDRHIRSATVAGGTCLLARKTRRVYTASFGRVRENTTPASAAVV